METIEVSSACLVINLDVCNRGGCPYMGIVTVKDVWVHLLDGAGQHRFG